jgi:hypothetical protein
MWHYRKQGGVLMRSNVDRRDNQDPGSIDSFSTFLYTIQRGSKASLPTIEGTKTVSLGLLRALKDGPQSVGSLMATSNMGLLEFAEKIKELREADLVEIRFRSASNEEEAHLTKMGQQIINIA